MKTIKRELYLDKNRVPEERIIYVNFGDLDMEKKMRHVFNFEDGDDLTTMWQHILVRLLY